MVTHLPSNEPDELIKKHFETLINKNIGRCKLEVESLCPAYEMKEFKKLQNNFKNANKYMAMQLNREKRQLKIENGQPFDKSKLSKDFLQKEAKRAEAKKALDEEEMALLSQSKNDVTREVCFVTFRTKFMKEEAIRLYGSKSNWIVWLFKLITFQYSGLSYTYTQNKVLKAKSIYVVEASDPSEVIWENLGIGKLQLFCRRMSTLIASFVVLMICLLIVFLLKIYQKSERDKQSAEDAAEVSTGSRIIAILVSITISLVNFVITSSTRFFTELEKHNSLTDKNASLMTKVVIAQFLNTTIMIIIIHVWLVTPDHNIASEGAILNDIWFILINDITLTPLFDFIDIGYFIRWFFQWRFKKSYENSAVTQEEANLKFEGTQMDPSLVYAKIVKLIWTSLFFLPIFPYAAFTCTIALFMTFWIYKHRLLRTAVRPISIGQNITKRAVDLLKLSPVILTVRKIILILRSLILSLT